MMTLRSLVDQGEWESEESFDDAQDAHARQYDAFDRGMVFLTGKHPAALTAGEIKEAFRTTGLVVDVMFAGAPRSGRGSIVNPHLREIFDDLADAWADDTSFTSNLTQIHMHPAYQRIIGMGPQVLPLVLQRLAEEPGHWFWALACISGEDPASGSQSLADARELWLKWGQSRGYAAT